MTQYVSPITQMISHNGTAVRMSAGVAVTLPEALAAVALTKGVQAVGAAAPVTKPVAIGATVDEVVLAIQALMEAGESGAFGVTGEPKIAALRKKVGKQVTDAVRDIAWAQVNSEE